LHCGNVWYSRNDSKIWLYDFDRDVTCIWIVGKETKLLGHSCGAGLTNEAADALGLKAGLPVAVSVIDAHAGALGNDVFICCFAFGQ